MMSASNFQGRIMGAAVTIIPMTALHYHTTMVALLSMRFEPGSAEERDNLFLRVLCSRVIASADNIPMIDGVRTTEWDEMTPGYATDEFIRDVAQISLFLALGFKPNAQKT